jgi:hypothetical protein
MSDKLSEMAAEMGKQEHLIERITQLEVALAECQKVRDEWCAEYTKLRDSQSAKEGK